MNAPARYIAHKLDPNALAIRDKKNGDLYMMFAVPIVNDYANYQIIITAIQENDHKHFLFTRETFSVKLFCSKPSVFQALVNSMLVRMDDNFELSSPTEFAISLGGQVNSESIPLPKRKHPVN